MGMALSAEMDQTPNESKNKKMQKHQKEMREGWMDIAV